jgi:hypothetical protein
MSFFVTSVGLGDGANLGGLAGADTHCQTLAQAVGAGNRTWRAYRSQTAAGTTLPVNARDPIGSGPWYNAKGVIIAADVDELHGDSQRDRNNIRKPIALNEKGEVVLGAGDTPNVHDILTGSDSHGREHPLSLGHLDANAAPRAVPGEAAIALLGHPPRIVEDLAPVRQDAAYLNVVGHDTGAGFRQVTAATPGSPPGTTPETTAARGRGGSRAGVAHVDDSYRPAVHPV